MTSRLALATTVAAIVLGNTAGALAQTYEVTKLVPGSAFHGVHGLGIDKSGRLFAGSVAGAALYEVDLANGTAKIAIPSPEGMADDIAFAPDGTMAWTGFLTGDLYSRKGDGPIKKLASGLPGINSLAFRKDGRLYATQVFLGDALYEIDVEGVKPPRKIMAQLELSLENLAIDEQAAIFVSNMADIGIQEVDPEAGTAKQVISGKLALLGGIGVVSDGAKETIYIADVFAYRAVDGATGE